MIKARSPGRAFMINGLMFSLGWFFLEKNQPRGLIATTAV